MATSSKNTVINIDLKLPTKWEDLSDEQLRYVYQLLAQHFNFVEIKTYCLHRWSGLLVWHRYGKHWACKHNKEKFILTAEQVEQVTHALDWLEQMPTTPVRISKIGHHRALDADFQGVPFETYIICDNLYQGYLSTKSEYILDELSTHLYKPSDVRLQDAERVSIFYWMASLKAHLARNFKHFFQPIDNSSVDNGNMFEQEQSQYEILQNAVNAQIRALTKGDITKEKEVLSLDTWRALTELDCQAKEYEEINRKYPSK